MNLKTVIVVGFFVGGAAHATNTVCPQSQNPQNCETPDCNKGCNPFLVGDPIVAISKTAFHRKVDLELKTTLSSLILFRTYNSTRDTWSINQRATQVPAPFGKYEGTLPWTHNWFSYVKTHKTDHTYVSTPGGAWIDFDLPLSSSSGWFQRTLQSPAIEQRLRQVNPTLLHDPPNVFDYFAETGMRLRYSAYFDAGVADQTHVFLTSGVDNSGREAFTVEYAPPQVTLPDGGPHVCYGVGGGIPNGTPYVSRVRSGDGASLRFRYQVRPALPLVSNAFECVIAKIEVELPDGGTSGVAAQYTYASTPFTVNGTEVSGFIRSVDGGSYPELYNYISSSAWPYLATVSSEARGVSTFVGDGVSAISTAYTEGNSTGLTESSASGPATICGKSNFARRVENATAQRGDGLMSSPSSTHYQYYTYEFLNGTLKYGQEITQIRDECGGQLSCSEGSVDFYYRASIALPANACASSSPAYLHGVRDRRGSWTLNNRGFDGASGGPQWQTHGTMIGAAQPDGTGALREIQKAPTYDLYTMQKPQQEIEASVVAANATKQALIKYHAVLGHPMAAMVTGWTKTIGSATPVQRTVATFFRTDRGCSATGVTDPLNRIVGVEGPCLVSNTSATSCAGAYPITEKHYYPVSASLTSNKLSKVFRYPNGCSSQPIVTRFDEYNEIGEATKIVEEYASTDVSTTVVAYRPGTRLATSVTVNGLQWQMTYDGDDVTSIQHPAGNFDVNCYRTNTSGACTGVSRSKFVQWRAKASDALGVNWTERVRYTYWPDGTLQTERFDVACLSCTNGFETRRVVHHASDAHKRPTWAGVGSASTPTGAAYSNSRGYDGANNLVAVGKAFLNPPAFCKSGSAHSPLCAKLEFDRANRLTTLDDFVDPSSSVATRACLNYDRQGNVTRVSTGCPASADCQMNVVNGVSTCDSSASSYETDDFGNVIRSQPANTASASEQEFDASGNLIARRTPAMAAATSKVVYTYDQLGRQTGRSWVNTSTSSSTPLEQITWDQASVPSSCAFQNIVANSGGRIAKRTTPVGDTYFAYDSFGRTIRETLIRNPFVGCSNSINVSPSTFYQYTTNGNLASITYPHGRTISYTYGTGATTDRVTGITSSTWTGSSWNSTQTQIISEVKWEPYGRLRSYRQHTPNGATSYQTVEYWLGDNSSAIPSTEASATPPSMNGGDLTGRLRALFVSQSTSGDIYRRWFTWRGDLLGHQATSLKGASAQVEDYGSNTSAFNAGYIGYDGIQRVKSAYNNFPTQGGWGIAQWYGYDSRGNQTVQYVDPYGSGFWSSYAAAPNQDRLLVREAASWSAMHTSYAYDVDGRVSSISGRNDSVGPSSSMTFDYNGAALGSESMFRAANINGAIYNYFYDGAGRRRMKANPLSETDEYFYDTGHHMLEDRGNVAPQGGQGFSLDEYIWLDGKAVAVWRNALSSNWATRSQAFSDNCVRNGETAKCGLHYLVYDYLPKPVLAVDSAGKIVGVGEYEPNGQVNKVHKWGETAHPYVVSQYTSLSNVNQPTQGLALDARVNFSMLDTEPHCGTNPDSVWLYNGNTLTTTAVGAAYRGIHYGAFWSHWITPSPAGQFGVGWRSGASYNRDANCVPESTRTSTIRHGAAMALYEYRRYESGSKPWWSPIRFPGQYFDTETGLHENWNRFYSPETGRYNSPDPLNATPSWPTKRAVGGVVANQYAYAESNPLALSDPTGLDTQLIFIGQDSHVAIRVDNAGDGVPVLFDPGGSYVPKNQGGPSSGDFWDDSDADIEPYVKYHLNADDPVAVFNFKTSPEDEADIANRFGYGSGNVHGVSPGLCAATVSGNIAGIGPFKAVTPVLLPSSLFRSATPKANGFRLYVHGNRYSPFRWLY